MERANQSSGSRLDAGLARRALRAAGLVLGSAGVLWWIAAHRIRRAARNAGCAAHPMRWILVPGHRLSGASVGAQYARRLERALALWQAGPGRGLLLSGQAEDPDSPSEAIAGLVWLLDLGLPPQAEVSLDETARDTVENLRHAVTRLGAEAAVVIVSNRYHLARCYWIARQLGLSWRVCAAESHWRGGLYEQAAVAREALSLLGLGGWRAALRDPLSPAP
jgi:uncharacterized SAM-binding protein YcdF (DUF218 family)